MISTYDIGNIIYAHCKQFGIKDMIQLPSMPIGEVTKERIVITTKPTQISSPWIRTFVEVNLVVPELKKGIANDKRLATLNKQAMEVFKQYNVGSHEGIPYRFAWDNIDVVHSEQLLCHYVNVRVLFSYKNLKQ